MNNGIKNIALKTGAALLSAFTIISMSACQSNPDSIVKNKDMDKLIEQAANKKETDIGIEQLMAQYDTYKNTINNGSLKVTVNIDAKVSIPQTDKMSVIRVKQQKITQELLDKVKKELVGDTPLYDGTVLLVETKKTIEDEIKALRDSINEMNSDSYTGDSDSKDVIIRENQNRINELEEKYKTAPEEKKITDNPSDGKLVAVADEYSRNSGDDYYSWMYSMDKKMESYYGISDGANKNYISLSALNSPDYGNRIMFRKGGHGYEFTSSVTGANISNGHWKGADIPDNAEDCVKCAEDTAALTRDEALSQAEEFITKIGITDFMAYECELYTEWADIRYMCDINGNACRTYYIVKYMRNINGAFVTAGGAEKFSEGWNGNDYVKKMWSEESIELRINDNGIVGFDYNVPITTVETVVDDSALKDFNEIKQTFEQMVVIANAQKDLSTVISIDKAVLGYARISERDSFDTGLLVPVWDFFGKIENDYSAKEENNNQIIMTINAIDGTVINRGLGY